MPSNYKAIARMHTRHYGTKAERWGEMMLARLYSDRTHFLYELMQNCEDALGQVLRAGEALHGTDTTLHLALFGDRLEVSHYGRQFSTEDVTSICAVAESTKTEDLTAIGKFGIGFKSVYAFTRHPEVHSGDEHFAIDGFVKPRAVPTVDLRDGETRFILPFDHPDLSAATAFTLLSSRLPALGSRSLLFLRRITAIHWSIADGASGTFRREERALEEYSRTIRLEGLMDDDLTEGEAWVLWHRSVDHHGQHGSGLGELSMAFRVEHSEDGTARVVPEVRSQLHVFFETLQESHLGFLINGPFQTTPSRESVPLSSDLNRNLVQEAGNLLADALDGLKALDLLDEGVLAALPLDRAHFTANHLLGPLFDVSRDLLRERALIPAHHGGFVRGVDSVVGPSAPLRDLLEDDDLARLLARNGARWVSGGVASAIGKYLRTELSAGDLDGDGFARRFSDGLIAAKADSWVTALYEYLLTAPGLWRFVGPIREKPIIRLEDGRHTAPFAPDGKPLAFLPAEDETHYPTVRRSVYVTDDSARFLGELGLKPPDAVDEVLEFILPAYSPGELTTNLETHAQDLRKILAACRAQSYEKRQRVISAAVQTPFLLSRSSLDHTADQFVTPSEAYWPTAELIAYFADSPEVRFLSEGDLDEQETGVLNELGVAGLPRRLISTETDPTLDLAPLRRGKPWWRMQITDYALEGLEAFLGRFSNSEPEVQVVMSQTLWVLLGEATRNRYGVGNSYFQGLLQESYKRISVSTPFDARFIRTLRSFPWLMGKDGTPRNPAEMAFNDLADGYTPDRSLETALGLLSEKIQQLAEAVGVDPSVISLIRQFGLTTEDVQAMVALKTGTGGDSELGVTTVGGASYGRAPALGHMDAKSDRQGASLAFPGEKPAKGSGKSVLDRVMGVQVRLRTNPQTSQGGLGSETIEVGEAGVQLAMDYETGHGRLPRHLGQTHKGFDIESTGLKETRHIEVKTLRGSWNDSWISLSRAQYERAFTHGSTFWLYVVENVESVPVVTVIQNPAAEIGFYMFSADWRVAAITE